MERSTDPVAVAAYCQVLHILKQQGCPNLRTALTKWTMTLLTQTPHPPYNSVVPVNLLCSRLVSISRYDECLASQIPNISLLKPGTAIEPRYTEILKHIAQIIREVVVTLRKVDAGKYSSEGAAREWSTVVIVMVIFIS